MKLAATRPTRLLMATTLVVGLGFGAMMLSNVRLRAIDRQVAAISGNAAPSMQQIAEARGDLLRLVTVANRADREELRAAEQRFRRSILAYEQIPGFPGERALYDEALAELSPLQVAIDRLVRSSSPAARQVAFDDVQSAAVDMDEALDRLGRLNADHARIAAAHIRQTRAAHTQVSLIAGIGSVFLAVLATVLALRAFREQHRLTEERHRLLAARATELERFAGRVAHDLRGPLTALSLRLAAASGHTLTGAGADELLGRLRERVARMATLIDGLFEFATAGAHPAADSTEAAPVVRRAVDDVEPLLAAAHAEALVSAETDARVACSEGVLSCVVGNLVQNAAKYIADGNAAVRRVEVRVRALDERVRVEVEDNGPGIAPEVQSHLFEPFFRGAHHDQPGAGLGLATVRRLVMAYGGRIGVRSTVGLGSCFWLELPRVDARAAKASA
jgi:signal transduction histidine kinase